MSESLGLETFACSRRQLTLTRSGCVKLFHSANGPKAPDPWVGKAACRGCEIGSAFATGHLPSPIMAVKQALSRICSRCGAVPERLIWNALCPSCDNRQREAIRGRNAKGNPPRIAKLLHPSAIIMAGASSMEQIHKKTVLSSAEVIIQASKRTNVPVSFGRPLLTWDAAIISCGGWRGSTRQTELPFTTGATSYIPPRRLKPRHRLDGLSQIDMGFPEIRPDAA